MRPSGRTGLALVALALLMLTTVPAHVLADHTYSHRYYVLGRVVDAEGFPVANVTIRVFMDSGTQTGSGGTETDVRAYRSDCMGRWGWNINTDMYRSRDNPQVIHSYLHIHEPRTSGSLKVEAVNATIQNTTDGYYSGTSTFRNVFEATEVWASASPEVNPVLRQSVVNLQLNKTLPENRCEGAATTFNSTYQVVGRLMQEVPRQPHEGGSYIVGQPITDVPVTATLTYNNGKTATGTANTNVDGDYNILLQLEEPLQQGTVRVEANGKTVEYPADTTFHTTGTGSELVAGRPWYDSKVFRFVAIIGGIALVLGGFAWYFQRGARAKETTRRKKQR